MAKIIRAPQPVIRTFDLLDQILTVLGSTTTTFWPFIEGGSLAAGEIVRSYGESVHIFTMTDPGSLGFMPYRHVGGVNSYHFDRTDSMNGAGEDSADFSFDDSGTNVCSFGAWVTRDNAGSEQAVLAKYDVAGTDREWKLSVDSSNKLRFELYDDSANAAEIATGDTNLTLNKWQFLCVTYDSAGGTSANAGLKLYLDATRETETLSGSGSYSAMQAGSTPIMLGAADDTASPTIEMDGRIALPFICGKELTAANVDSLKGFGNTLLGLA
jgi:hypothetical protein